MVNEPSGRGHAELLAASLRDSLADVVDESRALRGDIHSAERARRRSNRINLGVLGVLITLVALLLAVTWQNNRLAHQVSETNTRIADCTTAGGKCYEDGRARTGAAISDIIRAQVFVAECARLWPGESGPAFDRKMEACVAERLAAASARPSPSPAPSR
jgi:hypothetical protein